MHFQWPWVWKSGGENKFRFKVNLLLEQNHLTVDKLLHAAPCLTDCDCGFTEEDEALATSSHGISSSSKEEDKLMQIARCCSFSGHCFPICLPCIVFKSTQRTAPVERLSLLFSRPLYIHIHLENISWQSTWRQFRLREGAAEGWGWCRWCRAWLLGFSRQSASALWSENHFPEELDS